MHFAIRVQIFMLPQHLQKGVLADLCLNFLLLLTDFLQVCYILEVVSLLVANLE